MMVYLAGPINGCNDAECRNWRQYVTERLGADTVLDPMVRDYRGREDENPAEIVEQDKADIDSATHILVYYERPSVGTSMEVLYAWERRKPVILVTEQPALSPWLVYHSTHICPSLDAALARLGEEAR